MTELKVLTRQSSFPDMCPVSAAIEELANAGGVEERGAIFTRREVVDFILDLVGYTADQPLHKRRLLEPSFGDGDFLPAISACLPLGKPVARPRPLETLGDSSRSAASRHLQPNPCCCDRPSGRADIPARTAASLADRWLQHGDFLLTDLPETFDAVVGNPPYVRQELIPGVLLAEYRSRYPTMYDRADLYIPFIERSLLSLVKGGALGFICADRWMKNRYGGPLRSLVANGFL